MLSIQRQKAQDMGEGGGGGGWGGGGNPLHSAYSRAQAAHEQGQPHQPCRQTAGHDIIEAARQSSTCSPGRAIAEPT